MLTMPTSGPPIVVDCACCGSRLSEREINCSQCETPRAISHAVATRVGGQDFVSVLGASNAGKTVFLGMLLDMLSKGPSSFRGMATSAFSINLQQLVVSALEQRAFPEKTPTEADSWQWLHCQVCHEDKQAVEYTDLVSPDFSGEAIATEIDQPGLYPAIEHVVRKSSGVMILCDSLRVRDAGSGEDLFAMKIASYVSQIHSEQNMRVPSGAKTRSQGPAIAVVFTKSDACPEANDDPAHFAAHHTPRLYEYCRQSFPRHAFFAASVAGNTIEASDSSGRVVQIPLHIQPKGILEPLQWIIQSNGGSK